MLFSYLKITKVSWCLFYSSAEYCWLLFRKNKKEEVTEWCKNKKNKVSIKWKSWTEALGPSDLGLAKLKAWTQIKEIEFQVKCFIRSENQSNGWTFSVIFIHGKMKLIFVAVSTILFSDLSPCLGNHVLEILNTK